MSVALIEAYFPNLSTEQKMQFGQLQELYREWNSQINVISRKDIDQLYERHVLHSLAIARFMAFADGSAILDLGTGGGFPGIPLAILFPKCTFTLCDSIAKKIKVVEAVASGCGLKNVSGHWGRVEQVPGKFDFIVSRAVAPMPELIQWSQGKLHKTQRNPLRNGWICLKGGDLLEELSLCRKPFKMVAISDWFEGEFFETKKVVYVQA